MSDSIERAAESIHAELKAGSDIQETLTKYDRLIEQHPSRRADILSQRAYTWVWIDQLDRALADLREALPARIGGRLAATLSHLSGLLLQLHRFEEAEAVLARLIEVERVEASTYFSEYAQLMRAYCLARLGDGSAALAELDGLPDEAEIDWLENLPVVKPALIRELVARSAR